MKALTGAIWGLAGSIIIAAGVIGQDVCSAANRFHSAGSGAMIVGGLIALVGAGVTLWGLRDRGGREQWTP